MDAFTIIALALSIYALYEIHKMKEDNEESQKAMEKNEKNIHDQLFALLNQRCEIKLKKAMLLIDIAYSYEGKVVDIDDEWVVMSSNKGKKTIEKIIRISLIKDVKQLKDKNSVGN